MKKYFSCIFIAIMLVAGCKKGDDDVIDTEYPVIDLSSVEAFPKQCGRLSRGQKFAFKACFTDNTELGSYSVDIHHNFDHHTHSTEFEECELQPVKTPVKPFLLVKAVDIPKGHQSFEANLELEVPADVDPGDYHFMIRLSDQKGWQTIKGLSIKID